MRWIAIATEDELSERVGEKLIQQAGGKLSISLRLRRGGSGYLRSRLANFCQMAAHQPVVVITDLDRIECAPGLIGTWFAGQPRPPGLIFRVAVREIESWLLADHEGMKKLLGKRIGHLPREPDQLPDPKAVLLALAERSPREVRTELVAARGAIASQGLGYNKLLGGFVQKNWDPEKAASRSPSLHKALERIKNL